MFSNSESEKYEAAKTLILQTVQYQIDFLGKPKKGLYGELIHKYCMRYGLRKTKLGLMISKA
jgi:hypothetical protein